jgi:kinesin family protein 1
LIQLLNQSKVLWKTSGLFSVILKPPMTRNISELWRLNTANKYVRGEEFLESWKPRGVSLKTKKISECIRRLEAVECTKQILALHEARKGLSDEKPENYNSDDLAKKAITLWNKKWGTLKEVFTHIVYYGLVNNYSKRF